jgi:hypothetical protein
MLEIAQTTLEAMWPLLNRGRNAPLIESERAELRRLCDVLASTEVPMPDFQDIACELCLNLKSAGVLDTGEVKSVRRFLEYIDELRAMLK